MGHVQVIPREHLDYFDDLPPDLSAEILGVGQRLAPVLRDLYGVERVAFLFTGGDIAHAHAHVVPMVEATDITSRQYIREPGVTFGEAPRASDSDLGETARRIRSGLEYGQAKTRTPR
jgi:histidine triad (HIT) family protein